jgi:hypothetical protein
LSVEEAVTALLQQDRGIEFLLGLCKDEDEDVRYRGIVCVRSVAEVKEGLDGLRRAGAEEVLKKAVRESQRQEVLGVGVEVVKMLMGQ